MAPVRQDGGRRIFATKNRKCSKLAGHKGHCTTQKDVNPFWESSSVYQLNVRKRKFCEEEHRVEEELAARELSLNERQNDLSKSEEDIGIKLREKGKHIKMH